MKQEQITALKECLEQYFTFTVRFRLEDTEKRRLLSLLTARTGCRPDELLSAVREVDDMKNLQDERFCISRIGGADDLRLPVIDAKLAVLTRMNLTVPPVPAPESRAILRKPRTAGGVFDRALLDLARGLDAEAADALSALLVSCSCLPAGELLLSLYNRDGKERELLKVYRTLLRIYEDHLLMPMPEWMEAAARGAAARAGTELPEKGASLPFHHYDPEMPFTDRQGSIGFV